MTHLRNHKIRLDPELDKVFSLKEDALELHNNVGVSCLEDMDGWSEVLSLCNTNPYLDVNVEN